MNSYQKLKKRCSELENDIYLIVKKGNTREGAIVFARYKLDYDIDDNILCGESNFSKQGTNKTDCYENIVLNVLSDMSCVVSNSIPPQLREK